MERSDRGEECVWERQRHRDRDTDRETETERQRQERQRDRQRHRNRKRDRTERHRHRQKCLLRLGLWVLLSGEYSRKTARSQGPWCVDDWSPKQELWSSARYTEAAKEARFPLGRALGVRGVGSAAAGCGVPLGLRRSDRQRAQQAPTAWAWHVHWCDQDLYRERWRCTMNSDFIWKWVRSIWKLEVGLIWKNLFYENKLMMRYIL